MKYNFFYILLFLKLSTFGQDYFENIESPARAEFETNSKYPVSKATGIIDISLDLYEIKQDNIRIPIKLLYNSKGVKVNTRHSWVGTNWRLPISKIVQKVNDINDLNKYTSQAQSQDYVFFKPPPPPANLSPFAHLLKYVDFDNQTVLGNYFLTSNNPVSNTSQTFIATDYHLPLASDFLSSEIDQIHRVWGGGSFSSHSEYGYIYNIFNDEFVDSEPDIFTVSLLNYKTIKFLYDNNTNTFKILNDKLIKIDFNENDLTFSLTTPDETVYNFNVKTQFFTKNKSGSIHDLYFATDNLSSGGEYTWYLSEIITNKGNLITFEYQEKDFTYTKFYNNKYVKSELYSSNVGYLNAMSLSSDHSPTRQYQHIGLSSTTAPIPGKHEAYSEVKTSDQHLDVSLDNLFISKINYDGGRVDFITSNLNQDVFLDQVVVTDRNGIDTLKYDLHYLTKNRTFLKGIHLNEKLYREFSYNDLELPDKNSYSVDYWGYYNGQANSSYMPNPQRFINAGIISDFHYGDINDPIISNNNHSSVLNFCRAGILNTITYPTGGKTIFEYQLNEYVPNLMNKVPNFDNTSNNQTVKGNGLRVSKITKKDYNNSILSQKEFIYSSGLLPYKFWFFKKTGASYIRGYNIPFSLDVIGVAFEEKNYDLSIVYQKNIFSKNILDLNESVYYAKVEEKFLNVKNQESYSNIYHYHTEFPTYNTVDPNYRINNIFNPPSYNRDNKKNGTLLTKELLDQEGNLKERVQYDYVLEKSQLFYGVKSNFLSQYGHIAQNFDTNTNRAIPIPVVSARHALTFYPIYHDNLKLKSQELTRFYESQSHKETYKYAYDQLNRLEKESYYKFDITNKIEKVYSYNHEYLLDHPITTSTFKNGILQRTEKYNYQKTTNSLTGYDSYLLLDKKDCFQSETIDSTNCQEIFYTGYNDVGKVTEIEQNDLKIVLIWGYNNTKLIAKIDNISLDQINANQDLIELIELAKSLSNVDNDNCSEITCTESQLRDALNQIENHAVLKNSYMSYYTYDPLIGLTSKKEVGENIEFYEYDYWGRLLRLRDIHKNILKENSYNLINQ